MCGICGQINFRDEKPIEKATIERMTASLAHRGPDDEGYYINHSVGLGFRRLSIIDLAGGHQPMSDQEQTVWIVFNGEIYNYQELRTQLEGYGHRFRTNSDTEVIIHGYIQWGEDILNHLNGMFGLALWDVAKKKLMLARDPMGIKFVYYRKDSGSVTFGSEIRAVLLARDEKPQVDPVALNLFLRYRYTPSPLTQFKGVMKLAPGEKLIVEDGRIRVARWYTFKPEPFSPMKSEREAKEELLELYRQSMRRHLISDVPVGLLLSGGVDSGLLLGLMSEHKRGWPTYTVGYGKSFAADELVDAARTSELYSGRHTSVQIDRNQFEACLPKILSCLEEPICSSSIVPMYFVCERACQDVKVALVGQGPDELFGGYIRHIGIHYGHYWRRIPRFARAFITRGVNSLGRNEALKRGAYSLHRSDRMQRYQHVFSTMPSDTIDDLFHDDVLPNGAGDKVLEFWEDLGSRMENTDELGGFQFLELHTNLPDELLLLGDKLSMAHGLEVRVPYLDKNIVEFSERLSADFKIRNGSGKWLHRQVCREFMPREILKRPKKGFAVNVVDEWFRSSFHGKMTGYLSDEDSLMFQILRPEVVRQLLEDHKNKRSNNHKVLYSLVVFEEWLRLFVSSVDSPASV